MSLIPKQLKMSTKLGGVLVLLSKTMAFVSMFNFAMITRIQYYNADDDVIRIIFPKYNWFLFTVSIFVLMAMAFIYIVVIPSEIKFGNTQSTKDDRNPIFNLLKEVNVNINELKKEIAELKEANNENNS